MWIRTSATQTHMHCTACSPRAEGSDELKTCDEMLFQVDSARVLLLAGSACHADDCMMIACCADSMHAVIVSDEHVTCIKCPDPL